MYTEIIISAGHWKNTGSGANDILNEVTEARRIVKRVCEMLESLGVKHREIYDNVSANQDDNLNWLVKEHNKTTKNSNVLNVFIHLNANKKTNDPVGVECYSYPGNKAGKDISNKIIDEIVKVGMKRRPAKESNLFVLRKTHNTSILPEICFVDSKADAEVYKREFENICIGIVRAITGKTYQAPKPVAPTTQPVAFKIGTFERNVVVTADSLNVRKGRGTEHVVLGSLKKGQVVKVSYIHRDNSDGKGSDALWGSISFKGGTNGMGYIHLDYVEVK